MAQLIHRRAALQQLTLSVASFFLIGRLDANPSALSDDDEMVLAAATTWEWALHKIAIPYGISGEFPKLSPAVLQEVFELSQRLNPSNAPPIYRKVSLAAIIGGVQVQFSPAISVKLSTAAVAKLRQFLVVHPEFSADPTDFSDIVVVDAVLEPFRNGSAFKYD